MKHVWPSVVVALCSITAPGSTFGQMMFPATTVERENGTIFVSQDGISTAMTFGSTMDGITVTAEFGDNSSQMRTWTANSATSGGVTGTDWTLTLDGDTSGNRWVLSNNSSNDLIGLSIDAQGGDTVFDTIVFPDLTDGSGDGLAIDFAPLSTQSGLDVTGTYRNAVDSLADDPPTGPRGDVFLILDLQIASTMSANGLTPSNTFSFFSDTDSLVTPGDLTAVSPQPVPEPSSWLITVMALFGLRFRTGKPTSVG